MMIRWYCQLPLYTINSPLYCSNISFFSRDIFRICDKGDFFNIYIFGKWQSTFSLLLVKSEKIIFWRYIFRASRNLSDLFPLSLPDTIAFIPSGVNTQKKEIIPYPRCDYRADGIWYYFFFRLFSSNELNSNPSDFVENLLLFVKECDWQKKNAMVW